MSEAQGNEVSYALHTLGWKSFQQLCGTILSEILGQTYSIFSDSNDAGRDGAFKGSWTAAAGSRMVGTFTVQCKYSNKEGAITKSILKDDYEKAVILAAKGLSENYLLLTNGTLTGEREVELREWFLEIDGLNEFVVYGREWISKQIRESSRLRMLVPRIYGLGDLSEIIDVRVRAQAQEVLDSMGEEIKKFVITGAYTRSAEAMSEHGFVILLGEPGSGKSIISAALALSASDNWGCQLIRIQNPDEFKAHWNPNDPKGFFWVDDVFGATQYQQNLARRWNKLFPLMRAAVNKGAKIIFTSRNYIYAAAEDDLKVSAFPLLNDAKVVIKVQELTDEEKTQILYNHIKLGNQPQEFKSKIKPFLPLVVKNPNFLPESARRLGDKIFTKNLSISSWGVNGFIDKPLDYLIDLIGSLDNDLKSALAIIFMNGGAVESPIPQHSSMDNSLQLLGCTRADVRIALKSMKDSLVTLNRLEDRVSWSFKHPTLGEAYAAYVVKDPELIDIYLSGTSTEKLLSEITCGDVGIEGVKVIIPPNRFGEMASKLSELDNREILYFLGKRCDRLFLNRYLELHKEILNLLILNQTQVRWWPGLDLLLKLQEHGILNVKIWQKFVDKVEELAVAMPDAHFLVNKRLRDLMSKHRIEEICEKISVEVIPNFDKYIDDTKDDFNYEDENEDSYSWFADLRDTLEIYGMYFEDYATLNRISEADAYLDEVVDEIESDPDYQYGRDEDDGNTLRSSAVHDAGGMRDVFDDVDA